MCRGNNDSNDTFVLIDESIEKTKENLKEINLQIQGIKILIRERIYK